MTELNEDQKKLLSFLAESSLSKKFYWTGGTRKNFPYPVFYA